jgi:Uma2 family endonuclease
MTPPPDYPHNDASANLNQRLVEEVKRCGYAGRVFVPRTAIWVNDDTYLEPDLIYLSAELQTQMDARHWTRTDIVMEVISPSNALYDRRTKSDTYQAMGIRELWLIDPAAKEVEVRSFEMGSSKAYKSGEVLRSEVLTKIEVRVAELFS